MISHEYCCIFVHVPKTAGKSIESRFLDAIEMGKGGRTHLNLQGNVDPNRGPPRLSHLTASEYRRLGYVTPEQFEAYFKFAVVRNPWDRIVSEYKYRNFAYHFDFKTYLFKHLPKPGWTDDYYHIRPQSDFLYEDGKCLVDYVGRFETLEADFKLICNRLNLPDCTLPHVNKSMAIKRWFPKNRKQLLRAISHALLLHRRVRHIKGHYTEYYDEESRDFVSGLYQTDIVNFGYRFGENRDGSDLAL